MKTYSTLVYLALTSFVPLYGQEFTYHSDTPFGIELALPDSTRIAQSIFFYDYNGDGDLDLFLTGLDYLDDVDELKWINIHFFIQMQENIGDHTNPLFGPRQDVFTQFPYPVGYFFATAGDLNNDHRMDIIASADIDYIGNEKLSMLINTGLSGAAQFQESKMDAFGLDDYVPESLYIPVLTDLDGDGDLDLMTSGFNSAFAEDDGPNVPMFLYARNAGTPGSPDFQGWYPDPYGLTPDASGEILAAGDINNDGHIDFLGALINIPNDSVSPLLVHLNTPGSNGKPKFTTTLASPFGLPTATGENQFLFPSLVDIDGDNDLDLFVYKLTVDGAVLQYYENNLCQSITVSLTETICDGDAYAVGNETFSNPGDYMIHLISADGCDSIVLLTLEVDIVDPSVFVNDNILMAAQSGATYQWFDCDAQQNIPGATNQTYEVTVTGNYQVYVTDGFGCTVQSMCLPIIISAVDHLTVNAIKLYPNPATNIVYVVNETSYPLQKCLLMDVTGHIVATYLPDGKAGFNVSDLNPGVYMWSTVINGQAVMKKIVIVD